MEFKVKILHFDYYCIMHDILQQVIHAKMDRVTINHIEHLESCHILLEKEYFDILLIGVKSGPIYEFPLYIKVLDNIRKQFPNLKIIGYSSNDNPREIAQFMNAGSDWFISGSMGYEFLLEAIQTAKTSQRHFGQHLFDLFKNSLQFLSGLADDLIPKNPVFSRREVEVLDLIASGCSSKKISDVLHITAKTVESHRKNLVRKAKAKNTAELVRFAYSNGLL